MLDVRYVCEDLCKCDHEVKVCVFMCRLYLYVHAQV